MFDIFRNWRARRTVTRRPIAEALWREALQRCTAARRLGASDQAALRVLATLFLERKSLEPVEGLPLGDVDRVLLAAHACMPILKLGMDWYDGWHSIIVYPDAFMPQRQHVDAAGVVHQGHSLLAGEAWGRGPVILSWAEVLDSGKKPGHNVVIHEMAHKLDMLNGEANGFPPLHRRMDARRWSQVFSDAWHRLPAASCRRQQLLRGNHRAAGGHRQRRLQQCLRDSRRRDDAPVSRHDRRQRLQHTHAELLAQPPPLALAADQRGPQHGQRGITQCLHRLLHLALDAQVEVARCHVGTP